MNSKDPEMTPVANQNDGTAAILQRISEQFEKTCLIYLRHENIVNLCECLRTKLSSYQESDQTQISILVIWILNLMLDQIIIARLHSKSDSDLEKWRSNLKNFLQDRTVIKCIQNNKNVFYDLVANYGDEISINQIYQLNDDYEPVIRLKMAMGQHEEALSLMKGINNLDLIDKLLPLMMKFIAERTADALKSIARFHGIQVKMLFPTLISLTDENNESSIANFFQFCVNVLKFRESTLHNYLVNYYAKCDPKQLIVYFEMQHTDLDAICYDINFALKVCDEYNRLDAGIFLLKMLNQLEKAVDLALVYDVDVAKDIAKIAKNSDEILHKKIWLKIAKHVIEQDDDIEKAMEVIRQSKVLSIEDVLHHFSDFVTIDKFKDSLCSSLRNFNAQIESIKNEMDVATESANEARAKIQQFKGRYMIINSDEKCLICNTNVLSKPFYVFPCTHKFHATCLLFEVTPTLDITKRNRLVDYQQQLDYLNRQKNTEDSSTNSRNVTIREQIKTDIENIIASECLFCGDAMLQKIRTPLFDEANYDRVFDEWL